MNDALIACAPVKTLEGQEPYPHTHYDIVDCPLCKQRMYIGPRSKTKHQLEGTPIICMECVVHFGLVTNDNIRSLGGP